MVYTVSDFKIKDICDVKTKKTYKIIKLPKKKLLERAASSTTLTCTSRVIVSKNTVGEISFCEIS